MPFHHEPAKYLASTHTCKGGSLRSQASAGLQQWLSNLTARLRICLRVPVPRLEPDPGALVAPRSEPRRKGGERAAFVRAGLMP